MIFYYCIVLPSLYLLVRKHVNERKANRTEESKKENVDIYIIVFRFLCFCFNKENPLLDLILKIKIGPIACLTIEQYSALANF